MDTEYIKKVQDLLSAYDTFETNVAKVKAMEKEHEDFMRFKLVFDKFMERDKQIKELYKTEETLVEEHVAMPRFILGVSGAVTITGFLVYTIHELKWDNFFVFVVICAAWPFYVALVSSGLHTHDIVKRGYREQIDHLFYLSIKLFAILAFTWVTLIAAFAPQVIDIVGTPCWIAMTVHFAVSTIILDRLYRNGSVLMEKLKEVKLSLLKLK